MIGFLKTQNGPLEYEDPPARSTNCFRFYFLGISDALISLRQTYLPFLFTNRLI